MIKDNHSESKTKPQWKFVDDQGTFCLKDPHLTSNLYFPLVNEAGLMSSISPDGHGDIKANQNSFLMAPVSVEDLHNSRTTRNFWCRFADGQVWSAFGESALQNSQRYDTNNREEVSLEAGFLWQKVTRTFMKVGIQAQITSFIPAGQDLTEIFLIRLENLHTEPIKFTPTMAFPLFARSADNLRDHRHVTALLHRITLLEHGIVVKPTLSFDERGHQQNKTAYVVLAKQDNGRAPTAIFPTVESFIGEGGRLDWPQAVVDNLPGQSRVGTEIAGYEAMAGLRFEDITLQPGESISYFALLTILPEGSRINDLLTRYSSLQDVLTQLEITQQFWQQKMSALTFQTGDHQTSQWLRWVTLQPILRRLFGNSFLPYHDYGRGGRGWRDLWQDALALLLLDDDGVGEMLFKYYAGVRLDGSNATIIGNQPGEFKADRNDIARVWMDHGVWPLFTTRLYLERSGDLDFLLREQTYFKDQHVYRAQQRDADWQPQLSQEQRTESGQVYQGTILEHLLIQHLVPFYNVGEHNMIRLEGADWNDGMDMASQRGESVAFTSFYAGNLRYLASLLQKLAERGVRTVTLSAELDLLLDRSTLHPAYDSISNKQDRLQSYFLACKHTLKDQKLIVETEQLSADLTRKADWLYHKIREQEWVSAGEAGWFNGYYDNLGRRVEGIINDQVHMTLTGQVFPLMNQIASPKQATAIIESVQKYLWDRQVGGPRLNTDFGSVRMDLGRCFGFAYGHKENGAMFTHMAVMYAYALYLNNFVQEGYAVLDSIYQHVRHFPTARMLPGLPEYIEPGGRGVYPFLTGSASWYLFTLLTEAFGVKGDLGDLVLAPKLTAAQFDEKGIAVVTTRFAGRNFRICYIQENQENPQPNQIRLCTLNGGVVTAQANGSVRFLRTELTNLAKNKTHEIIISLV